MLKSHMCRIVVLTMLMAAKNSVLIDCAHVVDKLFVNVILIFRCVNKCSCVPYMTNDFDIKVYCTCNVPEGMFGMHEIPPPPHSHPLYGISGLSFESPFLLLSCLT